MARGNSQCDLLVDIMSDKAWRSAEELCALMPVRVTTAGLTARVRDLRKLGFDVACRCRCGRIWEYQLLGETPKNDGLSLLDVLEMTS